MTAKKKKSIDGLGPLRLALESERTRRPLTEIAAEAQIATKTLSLISDGPAAFGAKPSKNARVRAGLAESLTRLSIRLGVDPSAALGEFGLQESDFNVRAGVERARRTARPPQMVKDRALGDIEKRSLGGDAAGSAVNVGIVDWEPFHRDNDASSFAAVFMRRLLAAMNPTWKLGPPITIDNIGDAIAGLVRDEPTFEVVFGLYDTSYRRLQGLDFVPIPGLFVELGAVGPRQVSWPEILDPAGQHPFAIALEEEAGYHLLRGACGYEVGDVDVVDHHDYDRIAARLLQEWQKRGRLVVFVADAFSCREVWRAITETQRWRDHWPRGRDIPTEEQLQSFQMVSREWAPRVAVAVAVRADSPRFRELICAAMRADLFDQARLATAHRYQGLFELENVDRLHLDASSFEFLGREHAQRFAEAWQEVLKRSLNERPLAELRQHPDVERFLKLAQQG